MDVDHSLLLDYAEQGSTPSAPSSGVGRWYTKSDHKWYSRASGGSEVGPYLTAADLPPLAGIGASFTGNGDAYYVATCALTLDASAPQTGGTGTFTYYRAAVGTPTSFSAITTSTAFAVGDVLKITAAGVSGYAMATLPRTA